jgi:hypothetical protein
MQRQHFLLAALAFFALFSIAHSLSCGRVFDGPNRGSDRKYTHSYRTLHVNWEGFDDGTSNSRIDYAYALISQNLTTRAILSSGWDAPERTRCRSTSGLTQEPDLVDFDFGKVGHDTEVTIRDQPLRKLVTYYVIIRAKEGDRVTYSNTNGIKVINDDDDDLEPWEQGLIAMGCAIFCLLCLFLLLLLLLLLAKGKGEDKYTTTVHRNENVDKL